jgi:hypothetical protein
MIDLQLLSRSGAMRHELPYGCPQRHGSLKPGVLTVVIIRLPERRAARATPA